MSKAFSQPKIGVLGGGQLGRMLLQAGIDLNLNMAILDPDEHAPCSSLTDDFSVGSLGDFDTIYQFGKQCDIITIEIEKVNTAALKKLRDEGKKVFPQPEIVELIQDKRKQKQFYKEHDIPTAEFVLTENKAAVANYLDWLPAVHKLGRDGYDGKGVQLIQSEADLDKAFDAPGLLERKIPFEKEIAVIVSRNESGQTKSFPAVEMVFHPVANLVEYQLAPAMIDAGFAEKATQIAENLIEKLGMVGLLAVEMFLTKEGKILVNEIAPRPHNSGHQSIEGNFTSQFQQHLRAILNLPLGDTRTKITAAMVNLLGEEGYSGEAKYQGLEEIMAIPGVYVHLYGKKITRPFRKMGHVSLTDTDIQHLKRNMDIVKKTLKVIS